MKALLSSRPVLWFLFLFNAVVAATAPFVVDGTQGVLTAAGMGVVSLGAGVELVRGRGRRKAAAV
ncbi:MULTISPECIES: hypothetical protein [Streptomyces]|uniref:hypothetical protein n=1 Tax=Streptomyces TaxID=1883 RepID=UPI00089C0EC8|nr:MULTISPECIES: hypothetical protein [unclassified Streptomyces]SEC78942.1 hypothetical protein SAMN05428938_2982 [Streptomyces sp. KS_5]SEC92385.1 hypothetical protein SAMN05216482_5167 [Streptomyces sp. PAN_FS17]